MEGTYDIPYKNPYFYGDYWIKSDGNSVEMQIISYSFIVLKHNYINLQILKAIDAEVPMVFLFFYFLGGAVFSPQN